MTRWDYFWAQHLYRGLAPLPKGRRLRKREHAERQLLWLWCRRRIVLILHSRFYAGLWLRREKPVHGRHCTGFQCPRCELLRTWRDQVMTDNDLPAFARGMRMTPEGRSGDAPELARWGDGTIPRHLGLKIGQA